MSEVERLSWLETVPRREDELAAWLEMGRAQYDDIDVMGNAIKDASRDAQFTDRARAHWLGKALVTFGEQEQHEGLIGLGEIALGDAIRLSGDYVQGLQILDRAADRFEKIADDVGWARTRIGWVGHAFNLYDIALIEPVISRAMTIFEQKELWVWFVALVQNYAHQSIVVGELAKAVPLCEDAKSRIDLIEPPTARLIPSLSITTMLIQLYVDLGQYEKAQTYIDTGMEMIQNHTHLLDLYGDFLNRTSSFYLRTGQYLQCLYYIYRARQLDLRPDTAASLDVRKAQAYLYFNRMEDAEQLLVQLIQQHSPATHALQLSVLYHLLGEVCRLTNRCEEALRLSKQALDLMTTRTDPSLAWLGAIHQQYALLLHHFGRAAEAQSVALEALDISEKVGEHTEQVKALLVAAQVVSDPTAARTLLQKTYVLAGSVRWLRWRVNQIAAALATTPQERRDALVDAVTDLDFVQSSLAASFHANFLVEAQNLYNALVEDYWNAGEVACAWETVERVKSRALINTMMAQTETETDEESPLVAELKRLQLRHYDLTKQVTDGRTTFDEAAAALTQIENEITAIQIQIEVDQGGRGEPLRVPPAFIPHAPDGCDLIGYYTNEEAIYIFVHDGTHYYCATSAATPDEIGALQIALSNSFNAVAHAPERLVSVLLTQSHHYLQTLYQHLIAPVEQHLHHHRLVVVPHGPLHQLPFHLLRHNDAYLFDAKEIRVLPTARLLTREDESDTGTARHAVVTHSWNGQLPRVELEGALIAETLDTTHVHATEATKEKVLSLLSSRGILHLAAHGAHRPDRPELSHIQLDDGQLTLLDLFRYPVHKDLVTLSACETGQVVIRAGDDPVGLWRGFLAAGARSLLVSLWQLEDSTSQQLMTAYYTELVSGKSRVAALRHVQKEWLATATGRWQHPFYWGAFQLIGDDGFFPLNEG